MTSDKQRTGTPGREHAGDRLKRLREERGLSMRDIARLSEGAISPSYYSSLETGVAPWEKVSLTVIRGLARAFDLPIEELITRVDPRTEVQPAGSLREGKRIPVYNVLGSDEPFTGGDELLGEATVPLDWRGEYQACRMQGDAMSPHIRDGSMIVLRTDKQPTSGDVVCVHTPKHGRVLRELRSIEPDGTWVLASFNANYPPIYAKDVTVLGVVREVRIQYE